MGYPLGFVKSIFLLYQSKVTVYTCSQARGGLDKRWRHPSRMPTQCGFCCCTLCLHLQSLKGITPQLYPGSLKCTSYDADNPVEAAQSSVNCVRVVGQEAVPGKCVLLGTSKRNRKRMKDWKDSTEGCSWAVKLDVRDLGGHPSGCHTPSSSGHSSHLSYGCHDPGYF